MRARSPEEPHRAATPLELLFDLVFVVAIAQAAGGLHHSISEQHALQGLVSYTMVFFGIWWAWMNFTWFASAYDCDDLPYRLMVFVQMTGALIFAAGVRTMFESQDLNIATVGGYVVMRFAAVTQWLRASVADPGHRKTTRRYAIGVTLCQLAWIGLYLAPQSWAIPGFVVFGLAELLVPVWAEQAGPTTWHAHHIAERYGLFTIIVIGESILASALAVQSAFLSGERVAALAPGIVGGLLIIYCLWWSYFYRPVHDLISHRKLGKAIAWGYGHLLVFASAAAVGAGLAVSVDHATHHSPISATAAGASVALPAAIYLLTLWFLHYRPGSAFHVSLGPVAALLILLTPFTGFAVLLTGVILSALMAIKVIGRLGQPHEATAHD